MHNYFYLDEVSHASGSVCAVHKAGTTTKCREFEPIEFDDRDQYTCTNTTIEAVEGRECQNYMNYICKDPVQPTKGDKIKFRTKTEKYDTFEYDDEDEYKIKTASSYK